VSWVDPGRGDEEIAAFMRLIKWILYMYGILMLVALLAAILDWR